MTRAAAGPGEAVVAVAAAHVLWVETRIRSGVGREYWGVTPPYVPGSGVAGRVESVGQDVDPALLGARVVAHTGRSRDGYAELNRIHEELEQAKALQRRLSCPVLDVSNLAVEEAAMRVIELVEARAA